MKYRQLILLTDLESNDLNEETDLPQKAQVAKGWSLVRLSRNDIRDYIDYAQKSVSSLPLPSLYETEYALTKDIELKNDDPNAFSSAPLIRTLPSESFWVTIALRLVRPSAFIPHRILLRKDKSKWTVVQANVIHDHYVAPRGFSSADALYENQDIPNIQRYSDYLLKLSLRYEGKHHSVLKALDYFQESFRQYRYETSFLMLVIALEALYSYDVNNVAEQISMGVAYLLGSTPLERQALYERIKSVYEVRSKLVHGSKQKQKFYEDIELQKETYRQAYKAVQLSLTQIIVEDKEILFNSKEELRNLVLRNRLGII